MSSKPKHIIFLTTANLPTNPRLVKELDLARQYYKVTVILFKLGNWSDSSDQQMRNARKDVNFILLDATRQNVLYWFKWALLENISRFIRPLLPNNLFITALAHSRRSVQLKKALKRLSKPDLIISHNLGALYPAWHTSKKWNIPFIYDIEDYDPGIYVPQTGKRYKDYSEKLIKKCLPDAKALTSASSLIGEYTLKLIGGHPNHRVVLNSFPQDEFGYKGEERRQKREVKPKTLKPKPHNLNPNTSKLKTQNSKHETQNPELRLIWFSQHISSGRGLEQFFKALAILNTQHKTQNSKLETHITLIGHLNPQFDQQIIQPFLKTQNSKLETRNSITLIPPLPQPQLHAELSNHDIGLSLEFNDTDLNRQLCLTNKIIAYAQAGLYIIATDTPAQKQFIVEDPQRGTTCGQTPEEMAKAVKEIIKQKEQIKSHQIERFEKGKKLAWEKESHKIEEIWKKII